KTIEPAAVELATPYGPVRVDVLEVRQVEIDHPSDDPGDRLHASAHAWANDTATDLTMEVILPEGATIEVTAPVAEPGPLVAMKLQAIMNRSVEKQGTDLLDIIRLSLRPPQVAAGQGADLWVCWGPRPAELFKSGDSFTAPGVPRNGPVGDSRDDAVMLSGAARRTVPAPHPTAAGGRNARPYSPGPA
ncbi:MAG: hypothetical protein L0H64_19155, partial [Pseudonocardia sp.]|nr:hypothetical protein [Pseudonocardia sp.]